jgi:5-methylcytosine-specific restriction endonuclease McrA
MLRANRSSSGRGSPTRLARVRPGTCEFGRRVNVCRNYILDKPRAVTGKSYSAVRSSTRTAPPPAARSRTAGGGLACEWWAERIPLGGRGIRPTAVALLEPSRTTREWYRRHVDKRSTGRWSLKTMPFSPNTKAQALRLSGHRCECTRLGHGHSGRCRTSLGASTAQFHHKHAHALGGPDSLSNCEVLCASCHRQTGSYGRH